MRVNLRHLRSFAAVADAPGFLRAAERLHVSQSALSRQIQALEDDVGLALFERLGRQVRLTVHGEELLRRSRRLLAEADALASEARALKSGESGLLRIGATPQMIEHVLAPFLPSYRRAHPKVELQLVEDGGSGLPGRLERGDVHVALMPARPNGFAQRLLHPVYVTLVVPSGHPHARRKVVELADIAAEPLLLLQPAFASRQWFDDACSAARLQPRALLESAAPHTLLSLAQSRYGIAILPSNVLPSVRLKAVPIVQGRSPIGRWIAIAWDERRLLPDYCLRFIDEVQALCHSSYPGQACAKAAGTLPTPPQPPRPLPVSPRADAR